MSAKILFLPVGNGDMTLIRTESALRLDINIRTAADDPDDETSDARLLRDRLERDGEGRFYVDVFLVSHPHKDHCTGLRLGARSGRCVCPSALGSVRPAFERTSSVNGYLSTSRRWFADQRHVGGMGGDSWLMTATRHTA